MFSSRNTFDRRKTGPYSQDSREKHLVQHETMMAFSLLIFAFFSLAGATLPYKTAYFEQNLDHFNFVQDKTFKQRYLYTGMSALLCDSFYTFKDS